MFETLCFRLPRPRTCSRLLQIPQVRSASPFFELSSVFPSTPKAPDCSGRCWLTFWSRKLPGLPSSHPHPYATASSTLSNARKRKQSRPRDHGGGGGAGPQVGQDSFRITSRFAQLALNDYDPNSENLLADAEDIARQAEESGKWYSPDVAGLYNVYRVWLRRAANFWFQWLEERRHEYDPATQMPSWFPMQEGPLAVSRQIEWAVSRGDTAETLAALHPALTSSVARDRFAAAQLIEWSERTKSEPSYWRFGGGSGPGDAIQAAVRNMLGQGLNSGSPEQSSHRIEAEPSPAPAPGGSHGSIFGPMKHSVPAGSPLSSAASPAPGPPAPAPSSGAENSLPERRIQFLDCRAREQPRRTS